MTHQHDLSADSVSSMEMAGRSYILARVLSQVLHPMITTTLTFIILGVYAVPHRWHGVLWALFIIVVEVIPPMTFFLFRLKQGAYSDEEVSNRHQRNELYLFTFVMSLVSIGFLLLIGAPLPFIVLLIAGTTLNVSSWIINFFWKISIHSATAAMCATVALIYSLPLGMVLWVGALAVGWSRIRTKNHTFLQVVAGLALATAIILSIFNVFGLV
jgi:membrane-associated phospholipid phosphatase